MVLVLSQLSRILNPWRNNQKARSGLRLYVRANLGHCPRVDSPISIIYKLQYWPAISLNKFRPVLAMPLTVCEPLAGYLVIACKHCGARQPLHRDTSKGKSVLLMNYKWRCGQCGRTATYEPAEVERYQHIVERRKKPQA